MFFYLNKIHFFFSRRTGAWYDIDRPGVELATQLATHIAAVQPGVSGRGEHLQHISKCQLLRPLLFYVLPIDK